jgi:hypothetical protein
MKIVTSCCSAFDKAIMEARDLSPKGKQVFASLGLSIELPKTSEVKRNGLHGLGELLQVDAKQQEIIIQDAKWFHHLQASSVLHSVMHFHAFL